MSNNETQNGSTVSPLGVELPPVPRMVYLDSQLGQVRAYGLACAKAVADAKDARIAELELARDSDYEFDAMRHDRDRLMLESGAKDSQLQAASARIVEINAEMARRNLTNRIERETLQKRIAELLSVIDSNVTQIVELRDCRLTLQQRVGELEVHAAACALVQSDTARLTADLGRVIDGPDAAEAPSLCDLIHTATELRMRCDMAEAERDTLRRQLEAKGADAERYRWLRNAIADRGQAGRSHWFFSISSGHPEELDAAIDAARSPHPTAGADQEGRGDV